MRRLYLLVFLFLSLWELKAQYCTPAAGSSSQSYYLKTITLTDQSSINYSASSYQSYVDNSTQKVDSYPGGNIQLHLETSTSTAKYYVYIDWNNDFDFDDADESPIATTSYAADYTGVISVPSSQAQGTYRVRIELGYVTPTSPINACGPSNYGNFVDFSIQVGNPPSCMPPTAITSSNVTTSTADISWTPPASAPGNGYEYYYSTSNTAPDNNTVPSGASTTPSASLSGLSSATTYYVWVRSVCSATDKSAWYYLPGTFLTACGPMTSLYENFDSYATGNIVPTCWYRMTGTGSQTISSTSPASGTRNIYQYATASQNPIIVVLPEFSNVNAGTHWLRFKARVSSGAPGSLNVGYVTDINDPNTFFVLQALTINNTSYTGSGAEYTVPIPATIPANARLAIGNAADGKSYYWDDVYWEPAPTCFAPTSVVASGITANTADISWMAPSTAPGSGYEYYYSTSNTDPVATTTPMGSSTSTTASLSGLSPATTYYVWVRSVCSATDRSAWSSYGTFLTACAPMTDLYENFDSYTTGSIVPACWYRMTGTGSQTITSTTPASGTRNIYQYASSSQSPVIVVLPEFSNISAGTHWLRFKARVSSGAPGALDVGYVTDINDSNTFVALQTLTINNTSYTVSGAEYTVPVPATVPANARLAIRNAADSKSYYWDDVYWEQAPSCFAPTGISSSNVTTATADISWTAPAAAPANGYEYYYSTNNTAPDATVTPSGTSTGTSASLSSLSPATTYFVWVRSVCSATDKSAWSSYGTFSTACAAVMAPFSQNFDNGAVPNCWENVNPTATSTSANLFWKFTGSADYGANTANNGRPAGTYAWVDASSPYSGAGANTVELITPPINLTGLTEPYVSFEWFKNHSTSTSTTVSPSSYDDNKLTVEVNDGSGWTTIFSDTSNSNQWRPVGIALAPSYVGATIQVRFTVDKNVNGNGYFYDDVLLDNLEVKQNPNLATSEVSGAKNNIIVYPNPFTDVLNISDIARVKSVSVNDVAGRLVKTIVNPDSALHLSDLNSGMYLLTLEMKDGTKQTIKVIKK
ncbi:fibronectin type III domain-containing protein [Chryseobacterium gossypii]|uniref:fibronectin type III domain-containing protein n=1 Tax=Chryseobacterium gossypii TaxID=3231602 RepID=UPI0035258775